MNAWKYLACLESKQWKTSRLSPVLYQFRARAKSRSQVSRQTGFRLCDGRNNVRETATSSHSGFPDHRHGRMHARNAKWNKRQFQLPRHKEWYDRTNFVHRKKYYCYLCRFGDSWSAPYDYYGNRSLSGFSKNHCLRILKRSDLPRTSNIKRRPPREVLYGDE